MKFSVFIVLIAALAPLFPLELRADSVEVAEVSQRVENLWLLLATFLVFIMHVGFSCLEAGLTRAKNTVNILFKNFAVLAIGLLTYALCGFHLMFPELVEANGPALRSLGLPEEYVDEIWNGGISYWATFLFHAMFAATSATIVSGVVAERIKIAAFLVFSTVFVAVIYPVLGSWTWGGGWLDERGFHDFAGATLVHSVGGWAALAGAILVGPRLGKYVNSMVRPMMGHSIPLATLGVFFLWFGWFGFNGGSATGESPDVISKVMVLTALSASAGVVVAMFASWMAQGKPDLTMMLNGALAGLVGVTAGADVFEVRQAVFVGCVSGMLVVLWVRGFDKLRVDDPVGALSVHLVSGVWGSLAVGIFSAEHRVLIQVLGVGAYGAAAFGAAFALLFILKRTIGIRVGRDEELEGLDIGEHGMEAYNGFQIFTTQ